MTNQIKVGDNITWTHVSRRGKSLSMSLRCGIVEAVEGDQVTVIRPSGKRETVNLERVRRPGQKSQVSEFVEAMVESVKDKSPMSKHQTIANTVDPISKVPKMSKRKAFGLRVVKNGGAQECLI